MRRGGAGVLERDVAVEFASIRLLLMTRGRGRDRYWPVIDVDISADFSADHANARGTIQSLHRICWAVTVRASRFRQMFDRAGEPRAMSHKSDRDQII